MEIETISWSNDYAVGVEKFDKQHKEIIRLINLLNVAIVHGKEEEAVSRAVEKMRNYVLEHFADEELYLAEISYPEIEQHEEAHHAFINKLADYKEKIENGDKHIGKEISEYLVQWLVEHIQKVDKKYGDFASK